jgi:D-3-phosphoglycerate dehydrogenase / 2-oxoglutarate reductase
MLLVPTYLAGQRTADMYHDSGDIDVHYALNAEDRVAGGGSLGPAGQRAKAEQVLWDRIAGFDVVGALPGKPFITAALLDRAPRLKVVFIASAGYDSVDVTAATGRGIAVVNAAGSNAVPVSEHAIGLLLAVSRKIAQLDRRAHREGRGLHYLDVGEFPPVLHGSTLGLVGLGAIGRRVARIAAAGFGMTVIAYDPFADKELARELGVELTGTLEELLERSDAVSMHLPLTGETRHIISGRELALMKPGSFLVNTSRGGTVDTDALVAALQSGHLGGAGLDVTDPEPLPHDHPVFGLDNVVLTPHHGGTSPTAVTDAHALAAASVIDALHGVQPATLVNRDVWPTYLTRLENDAS